MPLPLSAQPPPVVTTLAPANDLPAPAERARILVVDDDPRNLLAIQTVLEDLADVVTATSGEEALRHLLKDEFAVILLDVYMSGIDGYETAQIIRARDQTRHIPIVFLSAVNKEDAHLMRGYAMGAVDYIFKPVEAIVLRSKVAVFVDLFTMRREIQRKAEHEQALLDANLRANAELLEIEQELRIAEQRQAAILRSLPIMLYVQEADRIHLPTFISGDLTAITGFATEDIPSVEFWVERIHPEDRERVMSGAASRRNGGHGAVEYRWRHADGSYRHFLQQGVLVRAADGSQRFAGSLLDVTDRKELERQLIQAQKMDAIGKLTGGIAHDFNNLLAAVLGGIGLIERRVPLDAGQKKLVGMTRHAAEQGSELVRRLLAFARRSQLQPAEIDFRRLSDSVTDLLTHTLGGLVRLEWAVPDDIAPAWADAAQLELALMNLAINARDAMADGGTITIAGRNAAVTSANDLELPAGDYVVLTISDTGCGIPPDILERVTEPFFTTKDVGKGTGLGLSMVYGFARQSDGAIDIRSEVGAGTSVDIWLPRAPQDVAVVARPKKAAARPVRIGDPHRRLRILLVDDHDAVRETTAALLRDLGHKVDAVCDGPTMLDMLRAAPRDYDLVVTDYAMPLLSGGEALLRAREIRADLPGLIISGYAEAQSIEHKPADVAVLTKPFAPEDISRVIAELCPAELSPAE
jgi:PAS domain S-box-containing protein